MVGKAEGWQPRLACIPVYVPSGDEEYVRSLYGVIVCVRFLDSLQGRWYKWQTERAMFS